MGPTRRRAAALAVIALLVACRALPAQEAPTPLGPGDHEVELRHGGLARYYLVRVPAKAAPGPRPLVLVLHGGGGDPERLERYGVLSVAEREGFVLVRPAGTGRLRRMLTWNAGTCCGWAHDQRVDDVGFLRAVVADVSSRVAIDRARVYAAGHSNGGMMALRLAAEAGDLVAAVCAVGGAMVSAPPRPGAPAVPILQIHSRDDPRALYDGGLGPPFPLTNVRVQHPPVQDTLDAWIRHDGCAAEPRREPLVRDARGHTAERLVWGPGRDGAEVVHVRLTGAGHGWPGAPSILPERVVGPPTAVIDAMEEAWRFFVRFRRSGDSVSPSVGPDPR